MIFIGESLLQERESTKAGNANASGTGSVRVSAQGLSCSRLLETFARENPFLPTSCPWGGLNFSRLLPWQRAEEAAEIQTTPGDPRMIVYQNTLISPNKKKNKNKQKKKAIIIQDMKYQNNTHLRFRLLGSSIGVGGTSAKIEFLRLFPPTRILQTIRRKNALIIYILFIA